MLVMFQCSGEFSASTYSCGVLALALGAVRWRGTSVVQATCSRVVGKAEDELECSTLVKRDSMTGRTVRGSRADDVCGNAKSYNRTNYVLWHRRYCLNRFWIRNSSSRSGRRQSRTSLAGGRKVISKVEELVFSVQVEREDLRGAESRSLLNGVRKVIRAGKGILLGPWSKTFFLFAGQRVRSAVCLLANGSGKQKW